MRDRPVLLFFQHHDNKAFGSAMIQREEAGKQRESRRDGEKAGRSQGGRRTRKRGVKEDFEKKFATKK